jgi:hypothetical protein
MTNQTANKQAKAAINNAFAEQRAFTLLPVLDWAWKKTPTTHNV